MSYLERGPAVEFANLMLISPATPDDLRHAIRYLARFDGHYRGLISELRGKLVVGQLPPVKDVRKGNGYDDSQKRDLWVSFVDGVYPKTPVQVKSNEIAVKRFRREAKQKGLKIIGLNCGLEIAEINIAWEFLRELKALYGSSRP